MHRLRNMACVRGIGPYQLGLRRDRGVRLVAPTAQRLRRDPQILGDLFDRLGLRRIRAARLGQQPDGLRLELRRVSRAFCHGSIISHRVRGNAEQKSVHISFLGDSHTALYQQNINKLVFGFHKKSEVFSCIEFDTDFICAKHSETQKTQHS